MKKKLFKYIWIPQFIILSFDIEYIAEIYNLGYNL